MNNKMNFLENGFVKKADTEMSLLDIDADSLHVHKMISSYLKNDIKDILLNTDGVVFGGAVRDSLADADDVEIHDVDIMALPRSANLIANRLLSLGYLKNFSDIDTTTMYTGIKVIHEPWTFMKNSIVVQIIRPTFSQKSKDFLSSMYDLLSCVDISACGVAYGYIKNSFRVIETFPDAVSHCKNKQFVVIPDNIMHQKDRIHHRVFKLESRGWKQLKTLDRFTNAVSINGLEGIASLISLKPQL